MIFSTFQVLCGYFGGGEAIMHFYKDERVALFVDGQNFYVTQKVLSFEVDYKQLLTLFRSRAHLIRAYYYTTLNEDLEFVSIKPLVDWLGYNGYSVVTKPARFFVDSSGQKRARTSSLIDIAVEAMRIADSVDHIVLMTGDGELCSLVSALQDRGKRVMVISTLESSSGLVSDDLRRRADQFVDLASLQPLIGRRSTRDIQTPISVSAS